MENELDSDKDPEASCDYAYGANVSLKAGSSVSVLRSSSSDVSPPVQITIAFSSKLAAACDDESPTSVVRRTISRASWSRIGTSCEETEVSSSLRVLGCVALLGDEWRGKQWCSMFRRWHIQPVCLQKRARAFLHRRSRARLNGVRLVANFVYPQTSEMVRCLVDRSDQRDHPCACICGDNVCCLCVRLHRLTFSSGSCVRRASTWS